VVTPAVENLKMGSMLMQVIDAQIELHLPIQVHDSSLIPQVGFLKP
jgi:hypothetical protein